MTRPQVKHRLAPDTMSLYLSEIRDEGLLSAEEEHALADAIRRGDTGARTRMIQANLRLVVKIAREYVGRGLVLDDLIGEGNLGLIRASEEYDPRFGTRFSTYASYWIKQAIRHALVNTTATIRLPAHMVGLLTKWRRAEHALTRQLGAPPSADQVAAFLGLSASQRLLVEQARRASQLRLESGVGDGEDSWSADESAHAGEPPEAALESEDEWRDLARRMERLEARERTILSLRFGLGGELPLTLKEVGRRLGVTREWVRKIELRAVRKLEHPVESPANSGARKTYQAATRRTSPASRSALPACQPA